jgi:iojap-like ribosome-associated protein
MEKEFRKKTEWQINWPEGRWLKKSLKQAKEKLAENIVTIDLTGLPGSADWFVICESDNTVQNNAIADSIVESLSELDTKPWHEEGRGEGRWVLIDYSDVIVHIMLPEVRSYYDLEGLWTKEKRGEK